MKPFCREMAVQVRNLRQKKIHDSKAVAKKKNDKMKQVWMKGPFQARHSVCSFSLSVVTINKPTCQLRLTHQHKLELKSKAFAFRMNPMSISLLST